MNKANFDLSTFKNNAQRINSIIGLLSTISPYIGAGMSVPIYPNWNNLITDLASEYGNNDINKNYIEYHGFIKSISDLCDKLGRNYFNKIFIEKLSIPIDKKILSKMPISLLPKIFDRGPIYTTNYDTLLFEVYSNLSYQECYDIAYRNKLSSFVINSITTREKSIIKLHGSIKEEASLIVSSNDYLIYEDENYIRWFCDIYRSQTLLFLGCSLVEDYTLNIVKKNNESNCVNRNHYALLEWDFENENHMHVRERDLISQYGIYPIWYPKGEHQYVSYFLKLIYSGKKKYQNSLSKKIKQKSTDKVNTQATPHKIRKINSTIDSLSNRIFSQRMLEDYSMIHRATLSDHFIAPVVIDLDHMSKKSADDFIKAVSIRKPKELAKIYLLYGKSGFGKTTLLGYLEKQLKKHNTYIFFLQNLSVKYILKKVNRLNYNKHSSIDPSILSSLLNNTLLNSKKGVKKYIIIHSYEETFHGLSDSEIVSFLYKLKINF